MRTRLKQIVAINQSTDSIFIFEHQPPLLPKYRKLLAGERLPGRHA